MTSVLRVPLLVALLAQATPTGGAIARFVPPVPTPASFVSDLRGVLTAAQRTSVDARIAAIQRAGLGDIAVAIIPSIGDYSANQVAVEIYRTWRVGSVAEVGSARRNVGVLILIVPRELSPNDRGECWINTGLGAEGIITDATAGTICRNDIIPHLRTRDYHAALTAGIGAIEARLRGDAGLASAAPPRPVQSPAPPRRGSFVGPLLLGVALAVPLALFGLFRWRRHRVRTCGRCGRKMTRLDEAADDAKLDAGQVLEEKLRSVDYDVWVCRCGESKVIPYARLFSKYSRCRSCNRRTASSTYHVLVPATTVSTGLAENRYRCEACKANWKESIFLPRIEESSSSGGGGGGHGGGGGGGGGHSFGGSGATSGGGGGGSY